MKTWLWRVLRMSIRVPLWSLPATYLAGRYIGIPFENVVVVGLVGWLLHYAAKNQGSFDF